MGIMHFDLYGVRARRESLRRKAEHPRFAAWWPAFVAGQRERLAEPAWPDAEPTAVARHARLMQAAQSLPGLALAALLTGDDDLAARGASLLGHIAAEDVPWMGPGHRDHYPELDTDLLTAELTKAVVSGVSWLADSLPADLVAQVDHALRRRSGEPLYRDSCRGAWWAGAHNSNWCAVLNSGLGAVALWLDEPAWLARAVADVAGVLDLAASDGGGIEGLGYWTYCFTSSLDLAEALSYAGDDQLLRHPFWAQASEFPLHCSLPDQSGWLNFGDCGFPGLGGGSLLYAVAAHTRDPLAQWLADRIVGDGPGLADFLRCDPDQPAAGPDRQAPCRRYESYQVACFRSGWQPDAVQGVLKAGSNAWSHCHLDLNSFLIHVGGERLAIDPGPWPYTPDYWTSVEPPQSTAWHNTLTVDGGDQRQPPRYRLDFDPAASGEAYSRLVAWHDDDQVAVACADATPAYADTLRRFQRWMVYLKPDTFVIYDDVRTRDERCQRHLQWLLHTLAEPEATADGLRFTGQTAALHLSVVRPAPWRWKRLADRCKPDGTLQAHAVALRPEWFHLWNVSPTRPPQPQWQPEGQPRLYGPDYTFLMVLQTSRPGAAPRWTVAGGEGEAVTLTAAGQQVTAAWHDTTLTLSGDVTLTLAAG